MATGTVCVPRDLLEWMKEQLPNHVALDGEKDLYRRAQLSHLLAQPVASEPMSYIPDYQCMFNDAITSLVLIGEAVGVRGEDQLNGHLEIIDAIHKIKSRRDSWRNIAEKSRTLFAAIEHGDNDHRNWLGAAISAHFSGIAVPEPYGLGAKELIEKENTQLREEIVNLRAAQPAPAVPEGWIPVSERLPEYGQNVLVEFFTAATGNSQYTTATLHRVKRSICDDSPFDDRWYVTVSSGHELRSVNRWMSLPAAPQPTEGSTDE